MKFHINIILLSFFLKYQLSGIQQNMKQLFLISLIIGILPAFTGWYVNKNSIPSVVYH